MHTSTAQAIANALRQARRIVIFTGAGMSAEINPEPSGLAQYMRHQWPTSAAQGLPQLLDLLHPV